MFLTPPSRRPVHRSFSEGGSFLLNGAHAANVVLTPQSESMLCWPSVKANILPQKNRQATGHLARSRRGRCEVSVSAKPTRAGSASFSLVQAISGYFRLFQVLGEKNFRYAATPYPPSCRADLPSVALAEEEVPHTPQVHVSPSHSFPVPFVSFVCVKNSGLLYPFPICEICG